MALKSAADWNSVGVVVNDGASIGVRSVCVPPVTIGSWALVSAGSVVTRDVPGRALVAGVARQIGWVGRNAHRLEPAGRTPSNARHRGDLRPPGTRRPRRTVLPLVSDFFPAAPTPRGGRRSGSRSCPAQRDTRPGSGGGSVRAAVLRTLRARSRVRSGELRHQRTAPRPACGRGGPGSTPTTSSGRAVRISIDDGPGTSSIPDGYEISDTSNG
jgi:hypothetical protein